MTEPTCAHRWAFTMQGEVVCELCGESRRPAIGCRVCDSGGSD
jgi:ribosomal protein L32